MNVFEACAAIAGARQQVCPEAVLVSTMSAQFAFDALGVVDRRIESVPLMGGAAGIGLGLALARPDLPVIVADGDSSLLMELGGLVTVAHNRPARFFHFVINNGVQFNGLTNIPRAGREPLCDFGGMAKAAGYDHVYRFDDAAALVEALPGLLEKSGASFTDIIVEPTPRSVTDQAPQPLLPDLQFVRMRNGVRRLKAELSN